MQKLGLCPRKDLPDRVEVTGLTLRCHEPVSKVRTPQHLTFCGLLWRLIARRRLLLKVDRSDRLENGLVTGVLVCFYSSYGSFVKIVLKTAL